MSLLTTPEDWRRKFVEIYFRHATTDQIVSILKVRKLTGIFTSVSYAKENRWQLELKQRWVDNNNSTSPSCGKP